MADKQETTYTVKVSGTRTRKMRDFRCQNEECEVDLFEEFVFDDEMEDVCCPECGEGALFCLSAVSHWETTPERTQAMLKKRSKQHMKDCIDKGIHPNDTGYSPGSPEWRNKTRAKNTSKTTMSQFRYAHKNWEVGKTYLP